VIDPATARFYLGQRRAASEKYYMAIKLYIASINPSRLRKYLAPKSPERSVQTLLVQTPQL